MTTNLVTSTDANARAAAIRQIIDAAAEHGIVHAIRDHGAGLTLEDRQLLLDLSPSDVDDLVALSGQASELDSISMDTNNNL